MERRTARSEREEEPPILESSKKLITTIKLSQTGPGGNMKQQKGENILCKIDRFDKYCLYLTAGVLGVTGGTYLLSE